MKASWAVGYAGAGARIDNWFGNVDSKLPNCTAIRGRGTVLGQNVGKSDGRRFGRNASSNWPGRKHDISASIKRSTDASGVNKNRLDHSVVDTLELTALKAACFAENRHQGIMDFRSKEMNISATDERPNWSPSSGLLCTATTTGST